MGGPSNNTWGFLSVCSNIGGNPLTSIEIARSDFVIFDTMASLTIPKTNLQCERPEAKLETIENARIVEGPYNSISIGTFQVCVISGEERCRLLSVYCFLLQLSHDFLYNKTR